MEGYAPAWPCRILAVGAWADSRTRRSAPLRTDHSSLDEANERQMFLERLQRHARQHPAKPAMRVKRDGRYRTWTCSDLWDQARSVAAFLQQQEIAPGERVALFAENSPEWLLAWLGVVLAGGVVVPLDAQYSSRELQNLISFAGCRIALYSDGLRDELERAIPHAGVDRAFPIDQGASIFNAPPIAAPVARSSDEMMTIIFTSGTTGDPKGVCLSLGNVSSNIEDMLSLQMIRDTDSVLCLLPLHHCYALTVTALTPLAAGADIVFCPTLKGPDILQAMNDTGITILAAVPKLLEAFDRALLSKVEKLSGWRQRVFRALKGLAHRTRVLTGWSPGKLFFRSIHKAFGPSFRFFTCGGAKLAPELAERFLDLGLKIIEGYGLSETSPVLTFNPLSRPRPGSVGLALPSVEIRIIEPDGDGVGQIVARGPNLMMGYERRPEDTAETIRDGWLHTGDMGYMDKDGHLHISGRAKEVIVLASGKNVYPEEVERHYEQSPLVAEMCALPEERPDGRVIRICAVVVPDQSEILAQRISDTRQAVRADFIRLSADLPAYMRVHELKLISTELPRTRLGKLRRAHVRELLLQHTQADVSRGLSAEDQALMAEPGAQALVARIREIADHEGPILPADNLELDLGLDSLARVELDAILDKEFNVHIPPEEVPEVTTVGDLLRRLTGERTGERTERGWGALLRERTPPPLGDLFPLTRSRFTRIWFDALRSMAFRVSQRAFPLDVRGEEQLPARGPYLLCPTHTSFIDAAIVLISLPAEHEERMVFLAAQERFTSRLMKWAGRLAKTIMTASSDTLLPSLRRMAEAIEMGRSVCIFPEGAISRDGFLQRPRPGAGIIACEMGVPIVPVLIRGTYDILSYTHPGFRFRPIGLTYGAPIFPPVKDGYSNEDYAAMVGAWRREITRLRREDDDSRGPTAGRSPRIPEGAALD